MAKKAVRTAYIDPKTGNASIVGGRGESLTDYQKKEALRRTIAGYTSTTDPEEIKRLQANTGKGTNNAETFAARGARYTPPTAQAIEEAKEKLAQFSIPKVGSTEKRNRSRTPFIPRTNSNDFYTDGRDNRDRGLSESQRIAREKRGPRDGEGNAKTKQEIERERIGNTSPSGNVNTTTPNITEEAVKENIKSASNNAMLERFKQVLQNQGREETGRIRTADTLARTAAQKLGQGSQAQSEIAQNVITGGRLSEGESRRGDQLANFETQQIEQQQAIDRQAATLAEQRAYDESRLADNRAYNENIRNNERLYTERTQASARESQAKQQEKQDFVNTINRFSNDFQAEINTILNDGDPTNDWKIPLLQSARQNKISGIEQSNIDQQNADRNALTAFEQQTYDRGIQKWDKGIALNANEAQVLGVPVGATKPRTSSGGSGGLSASGVASLAKWKIDNGLPLSASEARVIGVEEGYVNNSSNNVDVIQDTLDRTVTIDDISSDKKERIEAIINNPQLYDNNDPVKLMALLKENGITPYELDVYEAWRDSATQPFKPFQ